MTRVTFGVSASSFAANMSLKQNFEFTYPLAAKVAEESLTGADSVQEAVELQQQKPFHKR